MLEIAKDVLAMDVGQIQTLPLPHQAGLPQKRAAIASPSISSSPPRFSNVFIINQSPNKATIYEQIAKVGRPAEKGELVGLDAWV
jgi:hypothetical protein